MADKKIFNVRVAVCFFAIMSGFLSCIIRIAVISSGNYRQVQSEQSSYRVDIGSIRGTIFDCNKIPITNRDSVIMAAVSQNKMTEEWLYEYVDEKDKDVFLNKVNGTAPFVVELKEEVELEGVKTTKYFLHNSGGSTACHIIGYVGSDGHGVSGLEKAYDSLLYTDQRASAVFKTDGKGAVLKGEDVVIENETSKIASGVVTTIDINIQNAVETASEKMQKGAIVVIEIKSGKIRAMVSRPYYDINNVSDYLESDNSPLLNRCLSAYNVGSVFKPCVAAAALENKASNFSINCVGFEVITDRKFACHEKNGHALVDMSKALSQSCNVFFYNLALKIGADNLYNMASSLGFGNKIRLCNGIYTANGNLTERRLLYNDAELANLSIGQGRLLLTPVSILTLYCAIADGGYYTNPSLVEGTVENGKFKAVAQTSPTRVMSKENAQTLCEYLKGVISEGTGKAAKPKNTTAAGKTATAQTGRFKNGVEITHSWFCGFFPIESPQYAVCVMVEDGTGSAEIFSKIADLMAEQSPDF